MFKVIAALFSLLVFTGCTLNRLSVRTDYLSHENLASYYINTPDPMLDNPDIGQRLIISWLIPQKTLALGNLHIEISILLRNKEEIHESIPVVKSIGQYIYNVLNERYFETDGILTYKVTLMNGDCILEERRHQLWIELIKIGQAK